MTKGSCMREGRQKPRKCHRITGISIEFPCSAIIWFCHSLLTSSNGNPREEWILLAFSISNPHTIRLRFFQALQITHGYTLPLHAFNAAPRFAQFNPAPPDFAPSDDPVHSFVNRASGFLITLSLEFPDLSLQRKTARAKS